MQATNTFSTNPQPLVIRLPCDKGPYVWDKFQHREGIGSQFQRRKPSLVASHLLRAKWIGNLTNAHVRDEGDQSFFFGLSYPECDYASLKIHQKHPDNLRFIYAPNDNKTFEYAPAVPLATRIENLVFEYVSSMSVTNSTVIVFNEEYIGQTMYDLVHNFAAFDKQFRARFEHQRLGRTTPKREANEYWISMHFRWGDVKTDDPDKPNYRNALGFSNYCLCVKYILLLNPPRVKVFLFAEHFMSSLSHCSVLDDNRVRFLTQSDSWKTDIDIMSQSQLIIGGKSTFFVLGANLCNNCTVIHSSEMPNMFVKSKYEEQLDPHLKPIFCSPLLSCYLGHIKQHVKMYTNEMETFKTF